MAAHFARWGECWRSREILGLRGLSKVVSTNRRYWSCSVVRLYEASKVWMTVQGATGWASRHS